MRVQTDIKEERGRRRKDLVVRWCSGGVDVVVAGHYTPWIWKISDTHVHTAAERTDKDRRSVGPSAPPC